MKFIVNSFLLISNLTFEENQITRKSHFNTKNIKNIVLTKINQNPVKFAQFITKKHEKVRFLKINIIIGHFM